MLKLTSIIVGIIFLACNTLNNERRIDKNTIISLLIDCYGVIPEIAPEPNTPINYKALDSLNSTRNNNILIAIKEQTKDLPVINYKKEIEDFDFNLSKTETEKGIILSELTIKNKRVEYFDQKNDYDVLLSFSDIVFNKNKAIIECLVFYNKLNSSTFLFFLEKKEDKWIIRKSKLISLS